MPPRSGRSTRTANTNTTTQTDPSKLYINEDLTQRRSKLLFDCRAAKKKEKSLNDCWSFDGRILIKTCANKIMVIKSYEDLEKNITRL